ncbi:unnamed protein product [Dicrocoelium dendriticum]|nr:unnamed protein product [Dicrocoelium dendriticum]
MEVNRSYSPCNSQTQGNVKTTQYTGVDKDQLSQVSQRYPTQWNTKAGAKKSFVWKYFFHPELDSGLNDLTHTQCILCHSQLAFNTSGTTTTMLNHLKSKHSKIAEREQQRQYHHFDTSAVTSSGSSLFVSPRQPSHYAMLPRATTLTCSSATRYVSRAVGFSAVSSRRPKTGRARRGQRGRPPKVWKRMHSDLSSSRSSGQEQTTAWQLREEVGSDPEYTSSPVNLSGVRCLHPWNYSGHYKPTYGTAMLSDRRHALRFRGTKRQIDCPNGNFEVCQDPTDTFDLSKWMPFMRKPHSQSEYEHTTRQLHESVRESTPNGRAISVSGRSPTDLKNKHSSDQVTYSGTSSCASPSHHYPTELAFLREFPGMGTTGTLPWSQVRSAGNNFSPPLSNLNGHMSHNMASYMAPSQGQSRHPFSLSPMAATSLHNSPRMCSIPWGHPHLWPVWARMPMAYSGQISERQLGPQNRQQNSSLQCIATMETSQPLDLSCKPRQQEPVRERFTADQVSLCGPIDLALPHSVDSIDVWSVLMNLIQSPSGSLSSALFQASGEGGLTYPTGVTNGPLTGSIMTRKRPQPTHPVPKEKQKLDSPDVPNFPESEIDDNVDHTTFLHPPLSPNRVSLHSTVSNTPAVARKGKVHLCQQDTPTSEGEFCQWLMYAFIKALYPPNVLEDPSYAAYLKSSVPDEHHSGSNGRLLGMPHAPHMRNRMLRKLMQKAKARLLSTIRHRIDTLPHIAALCVPPVSITAIAWSRHLNSTEAETRSPLDSVNTESETWYVDIRINVPPNESYADHSYLYCTQKVVPSASTLHATVRNAYMQTQSATVTIERHWYPIMTTHPLLLKNLLQEFPDEDELVVIPCLCTSIVAATELLNGAVVLLLDKRYLPTASMILPFLHRLCERLHELAMTTPSRVKSINEACSNATTRSFAVVSEFVHCICGHLSALYTGEEKLHKTLILATLTDPRINSNCLRTQCKAGPCPLVRQLSTVTGCGAETQWMPLSMIPDNVLSELEKWNTRMPTEFHEDPTRWWSTHAEELPTLAKFAHKYLSIPATACSWRMEAGLPNTFVAHFDDLIDLLQPNDLPLSSIWFHSPATSHLIQGSAVPESDIPDYHFMWHNWKFTQPDDLRKCDLEDRDASPDEIKQSPSAVSSVLYRSTQS